MKKIVLLLVCCIVLVLPSVGATLKFTSNVSDAVTVIWKEYTGRGSLTEHKYEIPSDGPLMLENVGATSYRYIQINEGSDYVISDIEIEGNGVAYKDKPDFSQWYVYAKSADAEVTFNIIVKAKDEFYNGTLYLTVDDPSALNISFNSDRQVTGLQSGIETAVRFNTVLENKLGATPIEYGESIYSATKNEEPVSFADYNKVDIKDGDKINIQYNFPEGNASVTFNYTDGSEGFITKVTMDGEPVESFEDGFEGALGSKIVLYPDLKNFRYDDSISINGQVVASYGLEYDYNTGEQYVSFKLTKDTEININATPLPKINFSIYVDNCENIKVYRGYSYMGDIIPLNDGLNEVSISEDDEFISIQNAGGASIVSVTDDKGKEYYDPDDYSTTVTPKEGMVITIVTKGVERDKAFALFVEDPSGVVFNRADYTSLSISPGFSKISFCDDDLSFYVSLENSKANNVYVNDELARPNYDGAKTYYLRPDDGDVVKIYNVATPEPYIVSFSVEDGISINVTKDLLIPVEDYSNEITVLGVTPLKIQVAEPDDKLVYANNELLPLNDGSCEVTINGDTKISVKKNNESRISDITESQDEYSVYSVEGTCVLKNATSSKIESLPKGVYIINNKKIMIR